MQPQFFITVLSAALGARAIRILQTNDDGWAESYIRTLNSALNAGGHDVVLSAPAENQSGQGSSDDDPTPRTDACEYDSCPANSGPVGADPADARLNWVNSYPVTSARYGIDNFGPATWSGAKPDLVVSGPNVGLNVYVEDLVSGTIGAAVYAANDAGIPAIAFSGATEDRGAFNAPGAPTAAASMYAELGRKLVDLLVAGGAPYLPEDVFLNVNFPKVEGDCVAADDFKWVLTRVNLGVFSQPDVNTCGSTRLPNEGVVMELTTGCHVALSVADAGDKTTAPAEKQEVVLKRLGNFLTCLE